MNDPKGHRDLKGAFQRARRINSNPVGPTKKYQDPFREHRELLPPRTTSPPLLQQCVPGECRNHSCISKILGTEGVQVLDNGQQGWNKKGELSGAVVTKEADMATETQAHGGFMTSRMCMRGYMRLKGTT